MWPRIIILKGEILVLKVEDALYAGINLHHRQWFRLSCKLQSDLFEVVEIQMRVPRGVYELSRFQSCDLCNHHQQEGVRRYVERHAEEGVRAALIELQAETASAT